MTYNVSADLRSCLPPTTEVVLIHILEYLDTTHHALLKDSTSIEEFVNHKNFDHICLGDILIGTVELYHISGFSIKFGHNAIYYFSDDAGFTLSDPKDFSSTYLTETKAEINDPDCFSIVEKFIDSSISRTLKGKHIK